MMNVGYHIVSNPIIEKLLPFETKQAFSSALLTMIKDQDLVCMFTQSDWNISFETCPIQISCSLCLSLTILRTTLVSSQSSGCIIRNGSADAVLLDNDRVRHNSTVLHKFEMWSINERPPSLRTAKINVIIHCVFSGTFICTNVAFRPSGSPLN